MLKKLRALAQEDCFAQVKEQALQRGELFQIPVLPSAYQSTRSRELHTLTGLCHEPKASLSFHVKNHLVELHCEFRCLQGDPTIWGEKKLQYLKVFHILLENPYNK